MAFQVDPPPKSGAFAGWINWLGRTVYDRIKPGPFYLTSYKKSDLPSASDYTAALIYVTDEIGGAVPAFSDGTNWRRITDRVIVS